MNVIETDGLGKRYRQTWALRDCRLTVPAGHVAALVGHNGAGKTTLLRILAGVVTPTAGTATVLGFTPGSQQARDAVSAIDQTVPLYRHLRVRDQLAAARELNDQWDTDLAVQRLSSLNLMSSGKVGKLSGGQQAQLALTLALARRPRLLLLDEPLASLDPLARQEVLGWLMTCVAEDGLSVVFSSHVIAELERVATYLVVLSQGRVQVAATVDSLLGSHLALTGPAADAGQLAGQVPVITAQRTGRQAQVLARTDTAPPGWAPRPVTMEELVLGYLRSRPPACCPDWRWRDDRAGHQGDQCAEDGAGHLVQAPGLGTRNPRHVPAGRRAADHRQCAAAPLDQLAPLHLLPGLRGQLHLEPVPDTGRAVPAGGLRGVRQLLADGRHRGGGIPAGRGNRLVRRSAVGGPRVRRRRLPVHLDPERQSASLAARHVRTTHPARRGNRRDLRCRRALVVPAGAVPA